MVEDIRIPTTSTAPALHQSEEGHESEKEVKPERSYWCGYESHGRALIASMQGNQDRETCAGAPCIQYTCRRPLLDMVYGMVL